MTASTVRIEHNPRGFARLTLTRDRQHNAINAAMMEELNIALETLNKDAHVHAIVLAAEGQSFCAGADLAWMQAQFVATREARLHEARRLALMLQSLNESPKFTIARIHGPVFGGGIGLIAACDCVVASPAASFALTEARLGLVPATISPYLISRISENGARRMLSGRRFDADEALALGLVSEVAPDLDAAVDREIDAALHCSADAIAAGKRLLRKQGHRIDTRVIDATISDLADAWEQPEARKRIGDFLARPK